MSGPTVTLAGRETARVEAGRQEPLHEFREMLLSRSPTMFMKVREEIKARREALVGALHAAVQVGLPEAYVHEVKERGLGQCFGAFRRALTGEPPARVEPMLIMLKQGADLSEVKAKPRRYPPDRSAHLREHFQLLCDAGMV